MVCIWVTKAGSFYFNHNVMTGNASYLNLIMFPHGTEGSISGNTFGVSVLFFCSGAKKGGKNIFDFFTLLKNADALQSYFPIGYQIDFANDISNFDDVIFTNNTLLGPASTFQLGFFFSAHKKK